MKKLIRLLTFGLFAGFLFTACEGPQGPAGKDGKDGLNGLAGKDANASCLVCHNTPNQDAKLAEYRLSKHFFGNTSSRNTKYCARCHTSEGFQEIVSQQKYVVSNDIPNATRINCKTCHAHGAFDFTGDTVSQILATTTPVVLNYNNNTTATDFGKINNLCTTCHQIRGVTSVNYTDSLGVVQKFNQLPFFPFVAGQNDQAMVKFQVGTNFSVHDGNQSNLFAGINGYEYAGQTYTRTWTHSANSCTTCHMNEYNPTTKTGGHTLIANKSACTTCHGGADKLSSVQDKVDKLRVELAEMLVTRKVFKKTTNSSGVVSYSAVPTHDFYGTLFPTTESTTKYASLAGNNTVSATTGLVVYGNKITMATDKDFATRIGREWKYGELGAAYNYAYINSELSMGIHNPKYAVDLLQKSIDWLKVN